MLCKLDTTGTDSTASETLKNHANKTNVRNQQQLSQTVAWDPLPFCLIESWWFLVLHPKMNNCNIFEKNINSSVKFSASLFWTSRMQYLNLANIANPFANRYIFCSCKLAQSHFKVQPHSRLPQMQNHSEDAVGFVERKKFAEKITVIVKDMPACFWNLQDQLVKCVVWNSSTLVNKGCANFFQKPVH